MYNVFIMKNNFSPSQIATIDGSSIKYVFVNIKSILKLNKKIIDFIKNEDNIQTHPNKYFKEDDIEAICYNILRWRRCTAYLFIQISKMGYRHLCYFSDEIKHSSQSFGTSMQHVEKKTIIDIINDNVKNNIIFKAINMNNDSIIIPEDVDKYFGI